MPKPNDMGSVTLLAEAFAQQCVRWAKQATVTSPPDSSALRLLTTLARRLVMANHEGHVCIDVRFDQLVTEIKAAYTDEHCLDDTALCANLQQSLLQTGVVADAKQAEGHPLILDGHRLYLARHYITEQHLAQRLNQMTEAGRLCVISGGPGTGKTTTIARLLGRLLGLQPNLQIALAAPTGKAAARMMEALLARSTDLPIAIQERLPKQASTLHRLLGWHPQKAQPRHHAGNPLWLDLLIVDEASMLDLGLAGQLLDALPAHATLILLGDKDQLAAVEAGAVFAEISAKAAHLPKDNADLDRTLDQCLSVLLKTPPIASDTPRSLAEGVIWLQTSHRFKADSALGKLAAAVRDGQAEAALAELTPIHAPQAVDALADKNTTLPECRWINDIHDTLSSAAQHALLVGFEAYRLALVAWLKQDKTQQQNSLVTLFAAFDQFRILAATHQGPRGTIALNTWLLQALRGWVTAGNSHATSLAMPTDQLTGRPILILENAAATGLFNGDIGIYLPNEDDVLCAYFPSSAAQTLGFRHLPIAALPRHETAFALSVHKSQGSEFNEIALVFPQAPSPLLTRELLYTGLTRARQGVAVIASEQRLRDAIASPSQRDSGLTDRIWQQRRC